MTALEQAVVDAAIEVRLAQRAMDALPFVRTPARTEAENRFLAALHRLDDATDALMRERGV